MMWDWVPLNCIVNDDKNDDGKGGIEWELFSGFWVVSTLFSNGGESSVPR